MPAHKGSAHHLAVLNDDLVREARKQYRQGGVTVAELAEQFSCKPSALRRAIHGITWKHLENTETPDVAA
jgi:transposase-like protein